MLPCLVTLTDL